MSVEARGISKRFGTTPVLEGVTAHMRGGGLTALLGPSGSGKTTLLRVLAGLETPDAGTVRFGDRDVTPLPAVERRVGFVFQHYALFREMTVFENVAFGLRVRRGRARPPEPALRARVTELLERVELGAFGDRYPAELSGGQRQRVALARALAVEPAVLLLDEPFGALDAKVRRQLRGWLRALHDALHLTTVLVTHDQDEALELADHVVVLHAGKVEQEGRPEELRARPATPFVAEFLAPG